MAKWGEIKFREAASKCPRCEMLEEHLCLTEEKLSKCEALLAKAVAAIEEMQTASDAMMLYIARTTLAELNKERSDEKGQNQ